MIRQGGEGGFCGARGVCDLRQSGRGCGAISGVDPVSYTHLDVYKRQGHNRPRHRSAPVIARGSLYLWSAAGDELRDYERIYAVRHARDSARFGQVKSRPNDGPRITDGGY